MEETMNEFLEHLFSPWLILGACWIISLFI